MGPRSIFLPTLLTLLSACAGSLSDPISTELHRQGSPEQARALVVMLPGARAP